MEIMTLLILYIPNTLLRGWVIMKLWNWYVQPITNHTLNLIPAIGISILALMLTKTDISTKKMTTEEKITGYIFAFVSPLMSLFFGWAWYQFI